MLVVWLELRASVCMHCMYNGMCGILGNSLSFVFTLLSLMFFKLVEERAWHECTLALKVYCLFDFRWFCNLTKFKPYVFETMNNKTCFQE